MSRYITNTDYELIKTILSEVEEENIKRKDDVVIAEGMIYGISFKRLFENGFHFFHTPTNKIFIRKGRF